MLQLSPMCLKRTVLLINSESKGHFASSMTSRVYLFTVSHISNLCEIFLQHTYSFFCWPIRCLQRCQPSSGLHLPCLVPPHLPEAICYSFLILSSGRGPDTKSLLPVFLHMLTWGRYGARGWRLQLRNAGESGCVPRLAGRGFHRYICCGTLRCNQRTLGPRAQAQIRMLALSDPSFENEGDPSRPWCWQCECVGGRVSECVLLCPYGTCAEIWFYSGLIVTKAGVLRGIVPNASKIP